LFKGSVVPALPRDGLHNSLRPEVARPRAVHCVASLANSRAIGCKKAPCSPSRSAPITASRGLCRPSLASTACAIARPKPVQPCKGRPAALAASTFPNCTAMPEKGEGEKRLRGIDQAFQRRSTRLALVPPKPKLLDSTVVSCASRVWVTRGISPSAGSGVSTFAEPAMKPLLSMIMQ
jgi:hypothetical protein